MAKTLDKVELTRLAWLTALRAQGHRQCRETCATDSQQICAGHLLSSEILNQPKLDIVMAMGMAGLSRKQGWEVISMNDGRGYDCFRGDCFRRHTFAEIADVVEGWFSKP